MCKTASKVEKLLPWTGKIISGRNILLSWECARLPFCLFGAPAFCECCAYSSSLKRPEDKSEKAPLRREAGLKNRGRSNRKSENERQKKKRRSSKDMKSRLWWRRTEGAVCSGENNHPNSSAFHRGAILRRGERSAEISRNKSRGRSNEMLHPELPWLQITPNP